MPVTLSPGITPSRALRRNLDAVDELDALPRILGEQHVAVEIDVVAEAGDRTGRAAIPSDDSTMQPIMTPSPSARAACTIRIASRIPPLFASLMFTP